MAKFEVDIDIRSGVFFGDNRLILCVQDLEFPCCIAGNNRRECKTVFDAVAVRADEFVAGDDVENRRLIVNFCDRAGNCDNRSNRGYRVKLRSFGIPGIECSDCRKIGESCLSGRINTGSSRSSVSACNGLTSTSSSDAEPIAPS